MTKHDLRDRFTQRTGLDPTINLHFASYCDFLEESIMHGDFDSKKIKDLEQRIKEFEEAGKEATSLIAHLKDLHGFSEIEEKAQDKIMSVFKYEGNF